jgi:threonine dehydratase
MISRDEVEAAAARIEGYIRRTPVMRLEAGALGLGADLTLKLELFQHTGSFKPRGAFNRLLLAEVPEAGVITASGGNHGQALAHVARVLGIPAEIFVPAGSPPLKAERIRAQGAEVTVTGEYYDDAMEACLQRSAATGALLIHPYDHPHTVAGAATLGMELMGQAPDLDTVLVAAGGGGLAAGVAVWYQGDIRAITVEPESCASWASARAAGTPVDVEVGGIAADSLGARRIGEVPFEAGNRFVADSVLVPDEAILKAQWLLWDGLRILAEPGGAASLAALVSGGYAPEDGERVGVIVCGGNTGELPAAPSC